MERGLSAAVAALSGLFALSWSLFLLSEGPKLDPDVLGVAVVCLVQAVVTVGRHLRRRPMSRKDAGAALALAVVGPAVLALGGTSRVLVGQRCLVAAPAVLLATVLLPRAACWWTCVTAIGAQAATGWPADGPAVALESVWPVVATAVAGGVLVPVMRAAGERADRAQQLVRAVKVRAARAEGRREAHRYFQGMLHDEVSTALQAISLGGAPVAGLREAAADAVAALAAAPAGKGRGGRTDLAAVVGALRIPGGTEPTIELPGPVPVPAAVADAAAGAAREALRNVQKHAGAEAVHVRLEEGTRGGPEDVASSEGFTLSITDDGTGFAAEKLAATSVGLRRSVIRRMAAVGGWAEVLSAPGRGTTVRLQWCPPAGGPMPGVGEAGTGTADDLIGRMRAAVGDVRGPLAAVCLPFLAIMGVIAAIHTARSPGTGHLLLWYAILAAITVALLLRAAEGIPRPAAGIASAFAVAGALGSFHTLPLSGLADYTSWPIGAVTPLLTLLVIVRPAWEALTALAVEQAGIVVLVLAGPPIASSPGATVALVVPALCSPALGVIAGLAIGRTVARLGGATARAESDRSAALASEAARQAREELHRGRLVALGEEILPLLISVGTGECTPDDPDIRRRARLLAGAVRDEMHLPGVLGSATRTLLSRARAADCAVFIQSDSDDMPPHAMLRLLLETALRHGPTPRELYLTVNVVPGGLRPSLVLLPGNEERARALREAVAEDGATAVVRDSPSSTYVETGIRTP
ncbi:sensor histidine kinase [Streptomyces sp. NPDC048567]|uniref:sensor histidine kinase n=1 Tax=Streptomyces sp. NPDC048567 TaxID=3365570 RepID=UPI00371F34ED